MSNTNIRSVYLGNTLLWFVDQLSHKSGKTRSRVVVELITEALASPPPVLRHDLYLNDGDRDGVAGKMGGRVTIWVADETWGRVAGRARVFGESLSESVRALVTAGIARRRENVLGETETVYEKAVRTLLDHGPLRSSEFRKMMLPDATPRAGSNLLLRMQRMGLAEYTPGATGQRGTWKATRPPAGSSPSEN